MSFKTQLEDWIFVPSTGYKFASFHREVQNKHVLINIYA